MHTLAVGLAAGLLSVAAGAQETPPAAQPPAVSAKLAKILAKTDGRTMQSAIKVSSVPDEYKILKEMGLKVVSQGLVPDPSAGRGYAFDEMTTTDREGHTVVMWFRVPFGFNFGL